MLTLDLAFFPRKITDGNSEVVRLISELAYTRSSIEYKPLNFLLQFSFS